MISTMITETVAVIMDSFSACNAPAPVRTVAASVHGARITRPINGKIRNSSATAAGTASSSGIRLCQDCPAVAVPAERLLAGCSLSSVGSGSGLGKACLGQYCLGVRREDVVDEGLRQRRVLRLLQSGDRVGVDGLLSLEELDAVDLVAGG